MSYSSALARFGVTCVAATVYVALAAPLSATPQRANFSLAKFSHEETSYSRRFRNADITGTVTDSATGQPLPGAQITILRGSQIVVNATADAFGRYTAHEIPAGTYVVGVRFIGFRAESRTVTIGASPADQRVDFTLPAVALSLSAVSVSASVPLAVDTRSGDQRFQQDQYHGAPSNTTSQIVQQSIAGAARAPTGEVHIRGQHAEYTYYVDGVPVPAGLSGGLNELFDPSVVNQIDFMTGGWDAEYGNKNAAVIDVTTRIPAGGFHVNASTYGGSYNTNGQSASASANAGKWGVFFSGSRQSTDMRREPVMLDTASDKVLNFHNHGQDLFGFGKIEYNPSPSDLFNLEGNISTTTFQVPYDSSGGVRADDRQRDGNAFVNLGYRHRFGDPQAADSR
ncbi:MAG: carboxypeptidase regulatory-like domain-containing protein [Gemmatimonadales bacterium]